MFTFKLKPRYSRKEIRMLLDIFLTVEAELDNTQKCSSIYTDCRYCEYRNLCKDIKQSVQHLKTR